MRPGWGILLATAAASCAGSSSLTPASQTRDQVREVKPNELRAPADFLAINDPRQRSAALFIEVSRVLRHPRCVNCHPSGDVPHQTQKMVLHDPPVVRGPKNAGVPAMECATCHQDRNQPLTRVPGAPKWQLAPVEMAWFGKSPGYICRQVKDPARNGGKTLQQIIDHSAHDPLVAWGWSPGADREPAPGTQAELGALVAAWVESGAACPDEEQR